MSKEFCEHIEDSIRQGKGIDNQNELLCEIEKYFTSKDQELDYRKLCLVFMQRCSDFVIDAMRLSWAIDEAKSISEVREKASTVDISEICEMIGRHKSKIEKYYQDMREGKKSPRFRKDVPTETIVELKKQGFILDDISAMTGLSRSTVVNRLRKWKQTSIK